jgi:hypothetical protein
MIKESLQKIKKRTVNDLFVDWRLSPKVIILTILGGCFIQIIANWVGYGIWSLLAMTIFVISGEIYTLITEVEEKPLLNLNPSGKQTLVLLIMGGGIEAFIRWIGEGWWPHPIIRETVIWSPGIVLTWVILGEFYRKRFSQKIEPKPTTYNATREQQESRIA